MAWFLVAYKRLASGGAGGRPARVCAMDDFSAQIAADGGRWSEAECLGNHAVVKVIALSVTLQAIAAAPGFTRLPKDLLDTSLSDLSNAQKNAITNKLEALGYPLAEIRADLGNNIGNKTLRDVLRFVLKRRRTERYDEAQDDCVFDGPELVCKTVEAVDAEV